MEKNEMIFGIRAVIEAVEAGKEIDKILIKKDLQGDLAKELFDLIKGRGFFVQRVPVERLNRITRKNHQGVIAFISAVSYQRLGDIIPSLFEEGKVPFIVLLDGITDVRNFGAIARMYRRRCHCVTRTGKCQCECRCGKNFGGSFVAYPCLSRALDT